MNVQYASGRYFNTDNHITLIDAPEGLSGELMKLCARYERLFSRTREGSDVWNVNHSGGKPIAVDPDTAGCILLGLSIMEKSGGAFDMTVGRYKDLWSFTEGKVPSRAELRRAADPKQGTVEITGSIVTVGGVDIDLGGIAKGYVADRLMERVRLGGCAGALVDLGGNICVSGVSPSGEPWKIGVHDPLADRSKAREVFRLSELSVVTSSLSEQRFEKDGVLYHHILDPETGMPARSGLISATVVCACSAIADAASTAAFVLGAEKGAAFLDSFDNVEYLLINDSGHLIKSADLYKYIA